MDEDFLLTNELVDSNDGVEIGANIFFSDSYAQDSNSLLGILHPSLREDCTDSHTNYDEDVYREVLFPNLNNFPIDIQRVTSSTLNESFSPSEEDFIQLFRVKQAVADRITTSVKNSPDFSPDLKVQAEEQTLAFLFYIGQETNDIEEVCHKFDINAVTFDHILKNVSAAICSLSQEEICQPNETQKLNTKNYYALRNGLQGVIGCIDTLPVLLSKEDEGSVSSHEVVFLQAAVNENLKFIHVNVSTAAKTDEEILLMSPLYEKLPSFCSDKEYLLAGVTYPCLEHLLSPYPDMGDLSGDQILFNLSVAECMQATDAAFTLLLQRFRKLLNLKLSNTAIVPQLISACCVLHNMACNNDFENIIESPVSREMITEEYSGTIPGKLPAQHAEGLKLRDEVCKVLSKK